MFSLKGKTALITGAASGIGAAIAKVFADADARVFVADVDTSPGQLVAENIKGQFLSLDVTRQSDCTDAVKRVGRLDILVNNAGIGHAGTLLTTAGDDLDRLYAVNVRGVFNCCKAFVPTMVADKIGSVINIASIGGVVAVRERLAYTTTKFAVVGLTKAMALDHSHTGVRFNCICPGRVETPFVQQILKQYADPKKAYHEMAATQLQNRMVRPEEVAAAALYLASDESAMITGSTLMIDGGWSAGK